MNAMLFSDASISCLSAATGSDRQLMHAAGLSSSQESCASSLLGIFCSLHKTGKNISVQVKLLWLTVKNHHPLYGSLCTLWPTSSVWSPALVPVLLIPQANGTCTAAQPAYVSGGSPDRPVLLGLLSYTRYPVQLGNVSERDKNNSKQVNMGQCLL